MATPEGASDMKLYEQHQQLKKQISDAEEEWENVSLELEELKSQRALYSKFLLDIIWYQ